MGVRPEWGPDGHELFYRLSTGKVMVVTVKPDPTPSRPLRRGSYLRFHQEGSSKLLRMASASW